MKYKEEIWFPSLGTGETYGIHLLAGLLLIAIAFEVFHITKNPILALIFGVFGSCLAGMGILKETKRRSRAVNRAAKFKAGARKTTGRIISSSGGVRRYSFRTFQDDSVNSHGYIMAFEWNAEMEFEREDGAIMHVPVIGLNKNPKKYIRKEVTVYYNGNAVYVKI